MTFKTIFSGYKITTIKNLHEFDCINDTTMILKKQTHENYFQNLKIFNIWKYNHTFQKYDLTFFSFAIKWSVCAENIDSLV